MAQDHRSILFPNLSLLVPISSHDQHNMSQTPVTHPGPQTINLSYLPQRSRSLQEKDQTRAHIPPTISQTPSPQFSRCRPYSLTRANPRVRPILQYCTSSGTNDKLINWLNPAVNVLYSFSEAEAIGAGFGMVRNKSLGVTQIRV